MGRGSVGADVALTRWNDDRLDDLSRDVRQSRERLDDFEGLRVELAELRKDIRTSAEEAHGCARGLEALKQDLAARATVQHNERKADRRWMIGTLLATGSLVIAALAVFVG